MKKTKEEQVPRYYYRVAADTPTGQRMQKLNEHRKDVLQQAANMAKELGAIDFTQSPAGIIGGIGSLLFGQPQSTREYKKIGKVGKLSEYIPNATRQKGYELALKINKLPLIHSDEVMMSMGILMERDDMFPEWLVGSECFYFRSRKEIPQDDYVPCSEEEYNLAMTVCERINQYIDENGNIYRT